MNVYKVVWSSGRFGEFSAENIVDACKRAAEGYPQFGEVISAELIGTEGDQF